MRSQCNSIKSRQILIQKSVMDGYMDLADILPSSEDDGEWIDRKVKEKELEEMYEKKKMEKKAKKVREPSPPRPSRPEGARIVIPRSPRHARRSSRPEGEDRKLIIKLTRYEESYEAWEKMGKPIPANVKARVKKALRSGKLDELELAHALLRSAVGGSLDSPVTQMEYVMGSFHPLIEVVGTSMGYNVTGFAKPLLTYLIENDPLEGRKVPLTLTLALSYGAALFLVMSHPSGREGPVPQTPDAAHGPAGPRQAENLPVLGISCPAGEAELPAGKIAEPPIPAGGPPGLHASPAGQALPA